MATFKVKPNLFIIGAPKSGTTSMFTYLSDHPDVFLPHIKEPHYFGSDLQKNSNDFVLEPHGYAKLFEDGSDYSVIGEASVCYIYSEKAAHEIFSFNPNAKIVIMVRNAIELIASLHTQLLFSGNENIKDLGEALDAESDRLQGRRIPENCDLIEKLFYKTNVKRLPGSIQRYRDVFGSDKVKVILLDDLKNSPAETYHSLLEFLGISTDHDPCFDVVNKRKVVRSHLGNQLMFRVGRILAPVRRKISKHPLGVMKYLQKMMYSERHRDDISPLLREQLNAEFASWITEMEEVTGRDLSHWKAR